MYLQLPGNYSVRPPVEGDIQAIIDLMEDHDKAEVSKTDRYSPDEIRADWKDLNLASDGWCIFSAQGELCGYGLLWLNDVATHGRYSADGYVHPAHIGHGLGAALLDLMEKRAGEVLATQPEGTRQVLVNNIIASSAAARELFESRGYALTRVFFLMYIALDGGYTAPGWPEGIRLRVCDGSARDIRRAYETIQEGFLDHWGFTPRSLAQWSEHMVREGFDPSLWLLAMDGEMVAGASLCKVRDAAQGHGWIEQIAVRHPWRKRGIASALLRQSFVALYQHGMKRAGLAVDGQSLTGAQRLYEKAGMRVGMRIGRYEKELRGGTVCVGLRANP
jgi:mycothiol synthase